MNQTAPLLTAGLTPDATRLLELISSRGATDPLSIAEIRRAWPISERRIKALVAELRIDGWPIGARRGQPAGYYWITDSDGQAQSAAAMVRQAKRMLVAARRMASEHQIREWLGQDTFDGVGVFAAVAETNHMENV